MSRGIAAALICVLFGGCALRSEYLRIPVEGSAAMLVLAVAENGAITATAYELDGVSTEWTVPRPNDGGGEVFVALFACSLSTYGLVAGELGVVREETKLDFPRDSLWLSSANQAHGNFVALDARPSLLAGYRLDLPPFDPCVEFEVVVRSLDPSMAENDSRLNVAMPAGPRRALVGGLDGSWYDVQVESSTKIEPDPFPGQGALAAVARPDGKYYLILADGVMKLVSPMERRFEDLPRKRVRPLRPLRERAYFDGFLPDYSQEGFLVGENLEIHRFDEESWTLLSTSSTTSVPRFFGLSWYDEHRLIFAGVPGDLARIFITRAGETVETESYLVGSPDDEVNAVQRIAPGVVMLGMKSGTLYRWTETDRRALGTTPNRARMIVPVDDGVLFGGDRGNFSQWFPASGDTPEKVCEPVPYGSDSISGAVRVGDDLLLLTDNHLGEVRSHVAVWLLRKTPPRTYGRCSR